MAQYDYSISADTATGAVSNGQLWSELLAVAAQNPGFPALDNIQTEGDDLGIFYASALSAPQQTLLTAAVAAHTPAGPIVPPPTIEDQIRDIDPTVVDDDTLGFEPSVRWLNITSEEEYICTDSATGAAVWKLTTGSAGPPLPHAPSHQFGGSDVINVHRLSGTLADAQTPESHAATHLSTGSDSIDEFTGATAGVDGLDGLVTKPLAGEEGMFLRGDGAWASSGGGVFGEDYQQVSLLAGFPTSSSSFQTRLTLTTPVLTGTYRIAWMAVVSQSSTQDSIEIRLLNTITGASVGTVQRHEPKDTDDRIQTGGFHEEAFSSETKGFSIQWRQQDGGTATIRNCVIELWRVS